MAAYAAYGTSELFDDISDPCESPEKFAEKYLKGTKIECHYIYDGNGENDRVGYIIAIPAKYFRDFKDEAEMQKHIFDAVGKLLYGGLTLEQMDNYCIGFDKSDFKRIYEVKLSTTVRIAASDKSEAEDEVYRELRRAIEAWGISGCFDVEKIEEAEV